jgi:hypothetical protein
MAIFVDFLKRAITKIGKPTCPQCEALIPPADINLTQGTMLCRACGHLGALNLGEGGGSPADRINASSRDWRPDADPVPQPKKSKVRSESTARHLRIHNRSGHWGVALFLLFWLAGWTVGSFFLIQQAIEEPSGENFLFALIFVAPWFLVVGIFLYVLTGYETLTLTSKGITRRAGMLLFSRTKDIPIDQIRNISCFEYFQNSESKIKGIGLEILTAGPTVRFGKGLSKDEILWLDDKIRRYLDRHGVHLESGKQEALSVDGESEEVSLAKETVEVLDDDEPAIQPPPDTGFRYRRGFNDIVLQRRGTWKGNFGGFVVLTFLVLFWNGIISVFVIDLFNNFDWFSFFFLLPFELIGLAFFLGWFAMLTAPLWTRRFTFERGMATRRYAWAFFGYKTRYALGDLERIELREVAASAKVGAPSDRHGGRFTLVMVDTGGDEVLEIKPLTEAEGRWIGDQLLRDLPGLGISIRR